MSRLPVFVFAGLAMLAACSGGSPSLPGGAPSGSQSNAEHVAPRIPLVSRHYAKHVFYSRYYLKKHPDLLRRMHARPHTYNYPGPLLYHNGPVQVNPKIYIIFWGISSTSDTTHDPDGLASALIGFYSSIPGSSWLATVTQYSEGYGPYTYITNALTEYGGAYFDASPPNYTTYTDAQVQTEAEKGAAHFGLDSDANYVVVTPTG